MMKYLIILVLSCFLYESRTQTCSHRGQASMPTPQTTATTSYTDLVNQYDLTSVVFDLSLTALNKSIAGHVVLSINALQEIDTVALELHPNFTIDSVFVNDIQIFDISRSGNQCYLNPFFPLTVANSHHIRIHYQGTAPGGNSWGSGFVTTSALGHQTTYSLNVPFLAHHWWPCKQILPDLIDSIFMNVTTDTAYTVSSNGLRTSDNDLGNGKHRVSWETHYPTNYYLIAVNVGTHVEYSQKILLPGMSDSMLIQNFLITAGSLATKKAILDTLDDFLRFFSEKFGLYPFHQEKFGICQVNLSGGMEHQTLVNLSHSFDYYLAAHEMAHQWWGDGVNIDRLNDMWLNEGFASYCEFLTAQHFFPSQAANMMNSYHATAKSSSTERVYVDDLTDFTTIYNSMVYEKGAAILHTLRYLVNNDSLFFAAMTSYHYENEFASVNADVFKTTMESETGLNFDDFFNEWYYGYGFPKYSLVWNTKEDSLILKLTQTTTNSATPLFHVPVEIKVKRSGGNHTIVKMEQNSSIAWFQTSLDSINYITGFEIDPNNFLINSVISITKDSTLVGVNEKNTELKSRLFVYPNPLSNDLNIDFKEHGSLVRIVNLQGQCVYQDQWGGQEISTMTWPAGVYILSMENSKNVYTVRLVK